MSSELKVPGSDNEGTLQSGQLIGGACPLCGPIDLEVLAFRYDWKGRFLYGVTCSRCSLTFVDPQPTPPEISAMYEQEYFTENSDRVGAHGPRAYMEMASQAQTERQKAARRLQSRMLRHLPAAGSFLEVGCGPGFFLAEMRSLGWAAQGLELSSFAVRHAREQLGLEVLEGAVGPGVFLPGTFDAVFLGDVLEHLPDPLRALEAVRDWLKPGGVAAIAVPATLNLLSARLGLSAYRMTRRCKTLRIPPYHLFEYTPRTLRTILAAAGFTVLSLNQSAVPLQRMGLRGSPIENAGKISLQVMALATSTLFNRGGDRLFALATR